MKAVQCPVGSVTECKCAILYTNLAVSWAVELVLRTFSIACESLSWFFNSVLTLIFFFRQLHLIATWPGVRWSLNASVHFAIPMIFIFMVIVFIWQLNTKFERGNDWLYWINLYCDSLMLEMIFHGQCWNQEGDVRVSLHVTHGIWRWVLHVEVIHLQMSPAIFTYMEQFAIFVKITFLSLLNEHIQRF